MAINSNNNIPADIIPTYNLHSFVSNLMIANWVLLSLRQPLLQIPWGKRKIKFLNKSSMTSSILLS